MLTLGTSLLLLFICLCSLQSLHKPFTFQLPPTRGSKHYRLHDRVQQIVHYPMVVSSCFQSTVIAFAISGTFIICTVYFFLLISSFNDEATSCLHVQNIALLHLNRPLICCLHLNTCKQIYESTSCLVLMNSLPAEHSFYAFSCLV